MESQEIDITPTIEKASNSFTFYIIFVMFYFMYIIFLIQKRKKEPFSSYKSCVNQGYNNDFCLRTPPDSCVNCNKELKDRFIPKQFFTYSS